MELSLILNLAIALATVLAWATAPVDANLHDREWQRFLQRHGKKYPDRDEHARRYQTWQSRCKAAEEHNRKKLGFTLSCAHHFADWTEMERRAGLLGYKPNLRHRLNHRRHRRPLSTLAATATLRSVDWRTRGYVTPVKNQGQCGCCWSFAATGALEGQLFKKTGVLTSLSEQQLIDCDTTDQACSGGLPENAFQYLETTAGIQCENSYPYTSGDTLASGSCAYSAEKSRTKVTDYVSLTDFDEPALISGLQTVGPMAIGVCASSSQFLDYSSGIYTSDSACSEDTADHAVLIVGYVLNATSSGGYWIVKNSWSSSWGLDGYIKIAMGQQLVVDAVYPIL